MEDEKKEQWVTGHVLSARKGAKIHRARPAKSARENGKCRSTERKTSRHGWPSFNQFRALAEANGMRQADAPLPCVRLEKPV
jgi:hypothetical protein